MSPDTLYQITLRLVNHKFILFLYLRQTFYIKRQSNTGKNTAGKLFITLIFVIFSILSAIAIISNEPTQVISATV